MKFDLSVKQLYKQNRDWCTPFNHESKTLMLNCSELYLSIINNLSKFLSPNFQLSPVFPHRVVIPLQMNRVIQSMIIFLLNARDLTILDIIIKQYLIIEAKRCKESQSIKDWTKVKAIMIQS